MLPAPMMRAGADERCAERSAKRDPIDAAQRVLRAQMRAARDAAMFMPRVTQRASRRCAQRAMLTRYAKRMLQMHADAR